MRQAGARRDLHLASIASPSLERTDGDGLIAGVSSSLDTAIAPWVPGDIFAGFGGQFAVRLAQGGRVHVELKRVV